jgi:poly(3-hydroxybutyrate) depolymerase
MRTGYLFISIVLLLCAAESLGAQAKIKTGRGCFLFEKKGVNDGFPVKVHYYIPGKAGKNSPILFIMHGTNRNAEEYLEDWRRLAGKYHAAVFAPEFSNVYFPGASAYQMGNLETDAYISLGEVRDWKKFCEIIGAGEHPALKEIARQLAADTQRKIKSGLALADFPESGLEDLFGVLRQAVHDDKFSRQFKEIPGNVQKLLDSESGSEQRLGNRMLLESLFGNSLIQKNETGKRLPPKRSNYALIGEIFALIRKARGGKQKQYLIYGHSAGAQFVQRMVMLEDKGEIARAVAANAGMYLTPDLSPEDPLALGRVNTDKQNAKQALEKKFCVLLGENDNDPDDDYLPNSKYARRQGKTRLERGKNFFSRAEELAKELKADFKWEERVVSGATHSNAEMAEAAAEYLLKDN